MPWVGYDAVRLRDNTKKGEGRTRRKEKKMERGSEKEKETGRERKSTECSFCLSPPIQT